MSTADAAAGILATGHELAEQYAAAVRELNRHWADESGQCIGCPGEPAPCHTEWVTERVIVAIETRWRRESVRLAETRAADGQPSDICR